MGTQERQEKRKGTGDGLKMLTVMMTGNERSGKQHSTQKGAGLCDSSRPVHFHPGPSFFAGVECYRVPSDRQHTIYMGDR